MSDLTSPTPPALDGARRELLAVTVGEQTFFPDEAAQRCETEAFALECGGYTTSDATSADVLRTVGHGLRMCAREIERLRAALEAGEADTRRLDAISTPGAQTRVYRMAKENRADPPMVTMAECFVPGHAGSSVGSARRTLRQAIDAAANLPTPEPGTDAR